MAEYEIASHDISKRMKIKTASLARKVMGTVFWDTEGCSIDLYMHMHTFPALILSPVLMPLFSILRIRYGSGWSTAETI
jgi:hypothetical protein